MRSLLLAFAFLGACTDTDPTFMGVCEVGGVFVYPPGTETVSAACEDPFEIRWPRAPLRVSYGDIGGPFVDSADTAIDFWRSEVGPLFVHDETAPDVTLTIGSAGDGGRGATFHGRDESGALFATVELRGVGDITEAYYVLAHELGHVVGLAHDSEPFASVMYPTLDAGWDDEGFRYIRVTDNDQDALRGLYEAR